VEGKTLTAVAGSWEPGENEPTSTEFKWYECIKHNESNGVVTGVTCSLAASGVSTFALTSTAVGRWVEVKERAINPAGWELAESSADGIASQAPPGNSTAPTISGTVEVNKTLTEHEGTWTNPIAPTFPTWAWKLCEKTGGSCQSIPNAVAQTYVVETADAEHKLEVVEKDANGFGASEKESAETVEVPNPNSPPMTQTARAVRPDGPSVPTISGSAVQGATLTSHPASWSEEPTGFEYQWKRCEAGGTQCVPIEGATATSYQLVSADVGKTIVFKETASNSGGSDSASSAPSAVVAGAVPVSTAPPVIVGEAREGAPLVEFQGAWSNEPTAYRLQWERCDGSGEACEAIAGATAPTYDVPSGDASATIRVQETASNATGSGTPAVSSQTATVAPHPPAEQAPPTITGSGEVDRTLTAERGSWSGAVGEPGYQWLRCQLTECKLIAGATGATYVVEGEDIGYAIEVRESVTNAGGWEAADSAPIAIYTQLEPYVTALSPSSGSTGGGTRVTIAGKYFGGVTAVKFGGVPATSFELLSTEEITATAPPGVSGTVDVTVTTGGGTSSAGLAASYTYGPSPSVGGIVPAEGPSVGGTAVKIAGSNLAEATAVEFGETGAQSFTVTSASSITAIARAGTGTVGVTVQTRYGTTSAGEAEHYRYTATGAPPAIRKLSAKRGPAAGGTTLTITGSGFTAVSALHFGSAAAQSFTVSSPEMIVVESTPAGTAGTQNVTVTTPFGTSPESKHATFKYEHPVIANVSPDTGPKQGANKVTVTGDGFVPGEAGDFFKVGKTPGTEIECFSTTLCTMRVPAAKKPATVDVTVKAVKAASKKTEADHYSYYG
ncbi:MAG TPA: IPT/TIG domain-containing protein, partial [Solirubrobacteraceae bacterium]|nr:IPT/TIG domain-containing protein [Solirubrobacteraceae bacterium]